MPEASDIPSEELAKNGEIVTEREARTKGKVKGKRSLLPIYKDKLVALVASGVSIEDAAIYLGIGESTIYLWKQLGMKQKSGIYRRLLEDMKRAEMMAKVSKIRVVESAAKSDPKMALELLARKYPKEYGKKDLNMLTGKDGGPVEVEMTEWKKKLAQKLGASLDASKETGKKPE